MSNESKQALDALIRHGLEIAATPPTVIATPLEKAQCPVIASLIRSTNRDKITAPDEVGLVCAIASLQSHCSVG